ncbi:MAG: Arylsulfatase [Lentisphaerae bacterium ADurb.BinA184]|nr:MAG: Arylsulfatase [Lentisphaerae bacterium ADurb.BinA184]
MKPAPPSVLIITTDQQRTDSLGCYGSRFVHTPHLDRLAHEGVVFDRAYCANPVCTPSRATIFSGQSVSRHGAWNVGLNVPDDVPLLSHRLGPAGYRTHYVGKAHFQSFGATPEQSAETLHGWERRYPQWTGPYYGFETVELALGHTAWGLAGHYGAWIRSQVPAAELARLNAITRRAGQSFGGEAYDWNLPLRLHNSVWTAERTIAFLEGHDAGRPFLLGVGFEDPHHPHCVPLELGERVDPAAVPLPDFTEGELDDKPPHFLEARCGQLETSSVRGAFAVAGQGGGADYRQVTGPDARLGRAYYYTMIQLIDRQVGRILDCLDRRGLAENTLVVFTTDHGELLGDHGLWMKGPFHYEPLVRVPLIVRWPAGFRGERRIPALISHTDIAPTALAAAGQEPPADVDGTDALPLLRGETDRIRDAALIECIDDPRHLRLKTLVTDTRKLTWYAGRRDGELYDLEDDPREKRNRWDDPRYAADKATLLGRLLDMTEPRERRAPRDCYA